MKIFILAAGDASRWDGGVKQLSMVRGETVLQRMINMIKKFQGARRNYHILTHRREIKNAYARCVVPSALIQKSNPHKLLETVLASSYLWREDGEVCFLMGDVIFTEKTFLQIVKPLDRNFQFYGSWDEHFAFRFQSTKYEQVQKACADITQKELGTTWQLYRSLMGMPLDQNWYDHWHRTLVQDKTDDIDYPEDYQKKIETGYFNGKEFDYAKGH